MASGKPSIREALLISKEYSKLSALKPFEISCGLVFGSTAYGAPYISIGSDVDLCFFSRTLAALTAHQLVSELSSGLKSHGDKCPYYIDDNIGRRIEYSTLVSGFKLDVNIFENAPPGVERMASNSCRDGVDMLIPAIYKRSIKLFGSPPNAKAIELDFFPFYSDDLRRNRLLQLKSRIERVSFALEGLIERNSAEAIDTLFELRQYYLKYLFILRRRYPHSLFKNIDYQLKDTLNISTSHRAALMCSGSGGIHRISKLFLSACRDLDHEF